jgi:hypothetical protein
MKPIYLLHLCLVAAGCVVSACNAGISAPLYTAVVERTQDGSVSDAAVPMEVTDAVWIPTQLHRTRISERLGLLQFGRAWKL